MRYHPKPWGSATVSPVAGRGVLWGVVGDATRMRVSVGAVATRDVSERSAVIQQRVAELKRRYERVRARAAPSLRHVNK